MNDGWGRAVNVALAVVAVVFIVHFVLRYLRALG
jgi:hypothetical protein